MRTLIHHNTIFDDINFLTQLAQFSCTSSGDPFVVIKTAFAAGIPTLYAFNQFSCLDIVALRAGITWKCGKKLKPIARQGIPPWAGAATDFLYKFGPAQVRNLLWYYFIAQEATHTLARWTSLLYVAQRCDLPPEGACSVPAIINPFGLVFPGNSSIMTSLFPCSDPCGQCSGRSISANAGCSVNIIPMISYHSVFPDDPPSTVTCEVIEEDSGQVFASQTTTPTNTSGPNNLYVWARNLPSGLIQTSRYNVRVTNGGPSIIQQGACEFQIQWSGYKSEVIPAGCVPKSAHL